MYTPLDPTSSICSLSSEVSDISQRTSGMSQTQAEFLVPELDGKPFFEPGDGDMELIVDGTRIETHRYLIKRFVKWEDIGAKLQPGSGMDLTGNIPVEDLLRMLRVLYATTLEGPFEFDIPTLVSSLHLATEYEYPALREYAIRHLEGAELTAIQRIEIARKFDLPSWEKPAYIDLCNRDEAITEEEAKILGIAALVRISKIREKEQRRRGREVDMKREEQGIKLEQPKVENLEETNICSSENKLPEESPFDLGSINDKKSSELTSEHQEKETNTEARLEAHQDQAEVSEANTHPSFADVSITGVYRSDIHMLRGLLVPGCSCQYHERSGGMSQRGCILPPCAVATFKNLQNGQLAHTKKIEDLCLSFNKLQDTSRAESTFDQEVGAQSLFNPSIHEQVSLMLAELS
ncbi:hypothetical protein RSOLAG22IIIB_02226 [Rhizoctonia solani]|uniref:BTB domain-containing protein n=1 Tax=Rhizoctonia solani TaxID=456999 RepID=A0A0K6GED6_9AGAM|nr:hypothetical protein RSOLAG22IIIB_02226 [Rhizoctonia solani]